MKLQHLIAALEGVEAFCKPDIQLEQYCTGVEIAAHSLYQIQSCFGDIEGKLVADVGCGTGMLGIGCALLDAAHVVGFDIDAVALAQARANISELELDEIFDCVHCDVLAASGLPLRCLAPPISGFACTREESAATPHGVFDTAIMNPPFGTRRPGADVGFVKAGLAAVHANGCVYSMHKSSTRAHLIRTAESLGVGCEVVAQLRFDLPATYAFHSSETADVAVDLLRFVKGPKGQALSALHHSIPLWTPVASVETRSCRTDKSRSSRGGKSGQSSSGTSSSSASAGLGRHGGRGKRR